MTLRSIEKNFPHSEIFVVGHRPAFLSERVTYIPVMQGGGNWRNVLIIMNEVIADDRVPETFWFFNDDFFVLKKQTNPKTFYDMTLEERARRLKGVSLGEYARGAQISYELLREAGFTEPLNFDLHVPMPMDKTGLNDALGFVLRSNKNFWPHLRSIYGAMVGLTGEKMADVKIGGVNEGIPDKAIYVSSSPRAFQGQLGRELKALFPNPSKYEKNVRV
jgi:hypothetical protein